MLDRPRIPHLALLALLCGAPLSAEPPAAEPAPLHDLIVRGGLVYDGLGSPPSRIDLAVDGDRITALGDLSKHRGRRELDAAGLAVAPGFINMLSWATESLLHDGRALSDLVQGVTLEVFGEGWSMGPLNPAMREEMLEQQDEIYFDIPWTTLGEYLEHLERGGTAPNVASFVGATTVRIHVLGEEDRDPDPAELERMRELVRQAMREGALGLGSSLIYAPASYAETDELVALAAAAGEFGGMYISHLRSEGDRLLEAVDEILDIARRADVRAEIYHLKAAGKTNWSKLEEVIAKIEQARREGVRIGADMYNYTAGATGLDAAMPPWVQEGGLDAWVERLRDPEIRRRVVEEMRIDAEWENLLRGAGTAENVLLLGFRNDALEPLIGKTLAEVATARGVTPEEAAVDLVIEDHSRVETAYFLMSEENVRRQLRLPWVSFCSDTEAPAPEGVFLRWNPHPRAYGNVARLLGKYVREEKILTLEDAVRRLTSLPAGRLGLKDRGRLTPGAYADLVVFDPARIADRATYDKPHQLAVGVRHVVVNGVPALVDGKPTGELPGRVVRGPGWSDAEAN